MSDPGRSHPATPWWRHGLRLWFWVWFAVGLVVMAFDLELPAGGWGDFLFNALAAALILDVVARQAGPARAGAAFGVVAVLAGTVEWLGATTGFLFGHYRYTEAFGPRLGGVLPLAIPCAWWTVVCATTLLSRAWVDPSGRGGGWRLAATALLAGLLAVAFDLPLEVVAYPIRGYWEWAPGQPGDGWYGVPARNFLGWFVLGASLSVLVQAILGPGGQPRGREIRAVFGAVVLTLGVSCLAQGYLGPAAVAAALLALNLGTRSAR